MENVQTLPERYRFTQRIESDGQNSNIFEVKDNENLNLHLIMKEYTNKEQYVKEVEILGKLN